MRLRPCVPRPSSMGARSLSAVASSSSVILGLSGSSSSPSFRSGLGEPAGGSSCPCAWSICTALAPWSGPLQVGHRRGARRERSANPNKSGWLSLHVSRHARWQMCPHGIIAIPSPVTSSKQIWHSVPLVPCPFAVTGGRALAVAVASSSSSNRVVSSASYCEFS